jgi:thioredoxin 1
MALRCAYRVLVTRNKEIDHVYSLFHIDVRPHRVTERGHAMRPREHLRTREDLVLKKFCVVAILGVSMALSAMIATSSAEPRIDLKTLVAKRVPVLLEFGRGWCIPCKYMKPILEDMSKVYANKAIVMTVDMDANKDLVRDFRIRMMPTQVFLMPDGKEFFRNEGTLEREQIAQVFAKMGLAQPSVQGAPGQFPQAAAPQAPPAYPNAAR